MKAITKIKVERGCGYRKPGGYYFVAGKPSAPCGKLPLELSTCPTCGQGFPFSMAPKWVDVAKLFEGRDCLFDGPDGAPGCHDCPLEKPGDLGNALLIWVGQKFYDTAGDYMKEARSMGISRRIRGVPKGFEMGRDWVLLAHRHAFLKDLPEGAIDDDCQYPGKAWGPGIFTLFKPTEIEYIVKDGDTDDDLAKLIDRGVTPIVEVEAPDAAVVQDKVKELVRGLVGGRDNLEGLTDKDAAALKEIAELLGRLNLANIESIGTAPADQVYQVGRWLDKHFQCVFEYHWTDEVVTPGQGPDPNCRTCGGTGKVEVMLVGQVSGSDSDGYATDTCEDCWKPKDEGDGSGQGLDATGAASDDVTGAASAAPASGDTAEAGQEGPFGTGDPWKGAEFEPGDLVQVCRLLGGFRGHIQNHCEWNRRSLGAGTSKDEVVRRYRVQTSDGVHPVDEDSLTLIPAGAKEGKNE